MPVLCCPTATLLFPTSFHLSPLSPTLCHECIRPFFLVNRKPYGFENSCGKVAEDPESGRRARSLTGASGAIDPPIVCHLTTRRYLGKRFLCAISDKCR